MEQWKKESIQTCRASVAVTDENNVFRCLLNKTKDRTEIRHVGICSLSRVSWNISSTWIIKSERKTNVYSIILNSIIINLIYLFFILRFKLFLFFDFRLVDFCFLSFCVDIFSFIYFICYFTFLMQENCFYMRCIYLNAKW